MEKINYNDIRLTQHPVDGFTLSYITDSNKYFKQRYIGYGIWKAKQHFLKYVQKECKK
jgi:hypothetical protein